MALHVGVSLVFWVRWCTVHEEEHISYLYAHVSVEITQPGSEQGRHHPCLFDVSPGYTDS